jgi:translation initiation factor 4B
MSKKAKGQKMNLTDFLADQGSGSWADEIPELPKGPSTMPETSNTRQEYGISNITIATRENEPRANIPLPNAPPYTAFIGNMNFETTERDIAMFFGDSIHIKSFRMIFDMATNKPKGFGYVEFHDRDSLAAAIAMDGESLLNRKVRLNVAEGSKIFFNLR